MISSATLYFERITNSKNPNRKRHGGVVALKKYIEGALKDPRGSSLSRHLASMSMNDKSLLIAALIVNNSDEIKRLLLGPINQCRGSDPGPVTNEIVLPFITQLYGESEEFEYQADGEWLSATASDIIRAMLEGWDVATQAEIVGRAIHGISDNFISAKALHELIRSSIGKRIDHLIVEGQERQQGDISKKRYHFICQNKSLDASEFIVSTLGVLQTVVRLDDVDIKADFNEIYKLYHEKNYEAAIYKINVFCIKYLKETDNALKEIIQNAAEECVKRKPDENKDYCRKYYDRMMAQNPMLHAEEEKIMPYLEQAIKATQEYVRDRDSRLAIRNEQIKNYALARQMLRTQIELIKAELSHYKSSGKGIFYSNISNPKKVIVGDADKKLDRLQEELTQLDVYVDMRDIDKRCRNIVLELEAKNRQEPDPGRLQITITHINDTILRNKGKTKVLSKLDDDVLRNMGIRKLNNVKLARSETSLKLSHS